MTGTFYIGRNGPYLHRWKTNFSNMIFPSETENANSLVISHTLCNLYHVFVEGTGKGNSLLSVYSDIVISESIAVVIVFCY